MKQTLFVLSALLLVSAAPPAIAGDYNCKEDLATCARKMAEHLEKKGWVGIEMDRYEEGDLSLTKVIAGSPAEKAGLEAGDVLLALNGIEFSDENQEALKKEHMGLRPGNTIAYRLRRGSEELTVEVDLVPVPRHIAAQWIGQHILYSHLEPEKEAELAEKSDG